MLARWLAGGVLAATFLVGCTFIEDVDQFKSGECPSGQTACRDAEDNRTCRPDDEVEICGGVCRDRDPTSPCDGACPEGKELCNGICRDPDPDAPCNGNCPEGSVACGDECLSRNSRKSCDGGETCVSTMLPAFGCGANSCEPCALQNADARCLGDPLPECTILGCRGSWENCDGNGMNGCEVDIDNDPENCGGCGQVCPARDNVLEFACSNGNCLVFRCEAPFADCDGTQSNGCEANRLNDDQNCGSCGVDCTVDGKTCSGGDCI